MFDSGHPRLGRMGRFWRGSVNYLPFQRRVFSNKVRQEKMCFLYLEALIKRFDGDIQDHER